MGFGVPPLAPLGLFRSSLTGSSETHRGSSLVQFHPFGDFSPKWMEMEPCFEPLGRKPQLKNDDILRWQVIFQRSSLIGHFACSIPACHFFVHLRWVLRLGIYRLKVQTPGVEEAGRTWKSPNPWVLKLWDSYWGYLGFLINV